MPQWYYADRNRQRQGPIEAAELAALFRRNEVATETLVWRDGLAQWQALGDFVGELGLLDAAPAAPASETAFAIETPAPADDAAFAAVESAYEPAQSPYAPPAATLAAHAAVVHGGEVVYAGFWKRVAAYIIDSFVIGAVGGVIGAVLGGVLGAAFGLGGGLGSGNLLLIQVLTNVVSIGITAVYYAWFHASAQQATLGKMAVGIKVVRGNGEPIGFLRGIGRYFATFLSTLILLIGFVMAAFTARKQALHDMICDTLVVDKWAFTDHPEWQRRELGTVTIVILAIGGVLALLMVAVFGVAFATLFAAGR